jgi:hypothetical protein|tara:strand:+ start:199 stop:312 length:114 start_codon:yes stop_codon:yes gene_type:complete
LSVLPLTPAEAEEKGKTRPNNKATEGCCLLLAQPKKS